MPHDVLCTSFLVLYRNKVLLPTMCVEWLMSTRAAGHFRLSVPPYERMKSIRSPVVVQHLRNIVVSKLMFEGGRHGDVVF